MYQPIAAMAALLPVTACIADIMPLSQTRSVTATAQAWHAAGTPPPNPGPPVIQTYVAADYSPFVRTAQADAFGNGGARGHAVVDQDSTIGPAQLLASGTLVSSSRVGGTSSPGLGDASYEMTVRFGLSQPTALRLVSALAIYNSGPPFDITASGSTELIQHGASDQSLALSQVLWTGARSASLDQVFDLAPGEYSLRVLGHTFAHAISYNTSEGAITARINVSLTIVPGPGGLVLALPAGACAGLRRRRRKP